MDRLHQSLIGRTLFPSLTRPLSLPTTCTHLPPPPDIMGSINDWAGINLSVRGTFRGGETGDVLLQASHLHRWMFLHLHKSPISFSCLHDLDTYDNHRFQRGPTSFDSDIGSFVSATVGLRFGDFLDCLTRNYRSWRRRKAATRESGKKLERAN